MNHEFKTIIIEETSDSIKVLAKVFFSEDSITSSILPSLPPELYSDIEIYSPKLFIELKENHIWFNRKKVNYLDLKNSLKENMLKHDKYTILLFVDGESVYNKYIKIHIVLDKVMSEVRNDYSWKIYNMDFDNLKYDEQKLIKRKFPFALYEF